jgi:hypothetical protein
MLEVVQEVEEAAGVELADTELTWELLAEADDACLLDDEG